MKKMRLLAGIVAMIGGFALAQDTATTATKAQLQLTAEQRAKMADAHEKMAACLRSNRPLGECHDEMMKSCQETMGTGACPMMGGMGPMAHHGSHYGRAFQQGQTN